MASDQRTGGNAVAVLAGSPAVIVIAVVALIYFGAAKLGLSLAFGTRQVSAVWPPTGIALAALLLLGARAWPGIFVGAFAANATAAEPLTAAAGIAVGNTAMALAALAILRLALFDQRLGRPRDVMSLVIAAAVAPVVSASNGVVALAMHGLVAWHAYWSVWSVWWVGDAMGIMLVAPVVLAWLAPPLPRWSGRGRRWWIAESAVLAAALSFVSILALASRFALAPASVPVRFVVVPLVIWAAARFGARGGTAAVLLVAVVAAWGTVHGVGPFAAGEMDERLLQLEYYLAVLAGSGLTLNAIVTERERARGELERAAEHERAEQRFRGLLESAPDAMVIANGAGAIVLVNAPAEALFGYQREELTGGPVETLLPNWSADGHLRYLNHTSRSRAASPLPEQASAGRVTLGLAKDGRDFPAEISVSPLATPEGLLVCAAIRDVTQRRAAEQALRELAVVVESSRDAILAKTLDGIITVWNPAAERVYGYPAAEAIGSSVEMLWPADRKEEAAELLGRLALGEQVERYETVHVARDERLLHVELTLCPIRGHDDAITGASAIARDITERKHQQDKIQLARRIGDELADCLDPNVAARNLAASLVPALADAAAIDVAESGDNGSSGRFRLVAAEPPGVPVPMPTAPGKLSAPEDARATASAGSSTLSVPMRAHGRVVGHMVLTQSRSGRSFGSDDLAWAERLADRAGVALDNGQLYEQQRNTALTLQRSLMGSPAAPPGLDTAARYLPAADGAGVGGDWFDLVPLDRDRVGVVIGDVMGRGLEAAAVMGQLRSAGRALAKAGLAPAELMAVLDSVVADLPDQLVTCCYLIVDAASEQVCVCSAGHLPVLVVRPDSSVHMLPGPVNVPLGVGGSCHEHISLPLRRGSTLVLYTDGLVESRRRDIDGQLRLLTRELREIAAAGELDLEATADKLLARLLPGSDRHQDDVTLLLARLPAAAGGIRAAAAAKQAKARAPVAATCLDAEPAAAATARSFVTAAVSGVGCPDLSETAKLLTSELVTNAVRHARGPLLLAVRLSVAEVTVEVTDHSIRQPEICDADLTAETGRGMLLVDALADSWGSRLDGATKTVWFKLELRPDPHANGRSG